MLNIIEIVDRLMNEGYSADSVARLASEESVEI